MAGRAALAVAERPAVAEVRRRSSAPAWPVVRARPALPVVVAAAVAELGWDLLAATAEVAGATASMPGVRAAPQETLPPAAPETPEPEVMLVAVAAVAAIPASATRGEPAVRVAMRPGMGAEAVAALAARVPHLWVLFQVKL